MFKKNSAPIDKSTLPQDKVNLKPFMGFRPGVYLAGIYSIILIVILFFVLLFPGISNPGALLVIRSEPHGAAISVDGVYKTAAPGEVFAARGLRQIELSLPGFTAIQLEVDVRGRLFASLLFPRRIEIRESLTAYSPIQSFIDEAADYAAWTFAGEPTPTYQIPLSLSEGVYRFAPEASDPEVRALMEDTITASARFAVTRAALRDLLRAKLLLDNQGLSPSPLSLLGTIEDIIIFLDENPESAAWLGSTLSREDALPLTASGWHAEAAASSPSLVSGQGMPGASPMQIGLLNFRMIPGGQNLLGNNFHRETTVDTFYISETVISAAAWNAFLEQNPRWRIENTAALINEGLVSTGYLEIVSGAPVDGVAGISWYAARAFCQWLDSVFRETYPVLSGSWEIRLPTEAEWEYAARLLSTNFTNPFRFGLYWEWCEDPFAPLGFLSAPAAAIDALGSPERSVRGGSWINPVGSVSIETRASLPPAFASPFVSFRPVLAPRRTYP